MKNIIVLVSGGGTNLQALIDSEKSGEIKGGKLTCVISSNPDAYALERAKNNDIPSRVIPRKEYPDSVSYSEAILEALNEEKADLVVLAGFMTILDECVTRAYAYKIINVHPALIPSFCGEGYYGLRVHEAALAYGVKVSGATIHFVNEKADAAWKTLSGSSCRKPFHCSVRIESKLLTARHMLRNRTIRRRLNMTAVRPELYKSNII